MKRYEQSGRARREPLQVGSPGSLRAFDDGLQSVSPLDEARHLASVVDALAYADAGDGHALDSTTAKAHRAAVGGKGGRRRSRLAVRAADAPRKSHAIADARRRPIAIEVTPGPLGDVRVAAALISGVPPGRCWAADAAYDTDGLRRFLLERHGSGHPEQSDPQATPSFRRDRLSLTKSHRAHVLPPQGLETHRHSLRQGCSNLRRRRHARRVIIWWT
jgi:hypothetical protein